MLVVERGDVGFRADGERTVVAAERGSELVHAGRRAAVAERYGVREFTLPDVPAGFDADLRDLPDFSGRTR